MEPSRPALVLGTFSGSVLLHRRVSSWCPWVCRNSPRGCGAHTPHGGQGCSPQPASHSSCCSPCSSPAPTVLPAPTECAWLSTAREGVLSSGSGPWEPLKPLSDTGSEPGWPMLAAALWGGSFTVLFHTWCHRAGTPALKNRCLFFKGFVDAVPASGVPE